MELNKHTIAERFANLPRDKQSVFLEALRQQSIDFSTLPIVPRKEQESSELSYAQMRQWFLWRMDPQSSAYHINGALTLKGTPSPEALRDSFTDIVSRHEALRTVFRDDGKGGVMQVVLAESNFAWHEIDLSHMPKDKRETAIENQVARLCNEPFNLEQGPLLRVGLLRLANEEHLLVVVMHHIVSDGWSMQLIIDEFSAGYCARVTGEAWQPAALPIQYADYALWQRQWMEAGEKERQLAYWQAELGDEHPVLQLPTDRLRRNDGHYHAARHEIMLPESIVSGLRQRSQEMGATLFMALLTGFQALLYRHTGQEDIRVGVPTANRHRRETQRVVGFFVNTQVLRNQLSDHSSLVDALEKSKRAALGAQDHQDLPFEQLVEALQPERSLSHPPLFQVMFNHQQQDHGALQTLPGMELSIWPIEKGEAQFELTLNVIERTDGCLEASFVYAEELFDSNSIGRLAQHYIVILQALAEMPERVLRDIELLDDDERFQLQAWGVNTQQYPDAQPIHQLIERQAEVTPGATALVFEEQSLSYVELNTRANRLAHYLIDLGGRPETRVGIAVERSIEMVVGLLAILKAGGTYVPLDPDYPAERLAYMVEDSGIELLLTQQHLRDTLPVAESLSVIELDRLEVAHHASNNPEVALHGEHLAYVIYTSGSTGRPKGVMVRHHALSHFLFSMQETPGLSPDDILVAVTSLSFDIAALELYLPLISGARVVLASRETTRDGRALGELLNQEKATVLQATPSGWRLLRSSGWPWTTAPLSEGFKGLCGGEALPPDLAEDLQAQGIELWNMYGPTETTIWSATDRVKDSQVFLGSAIAATQLYVLDGALNFAPPGVAGELYLGGVGMARGYLGRAELTAERFVADPFIAGERVYRTGDLVRWREDGQLEYLGRIDHQIKVRGFRIELGDIEAQLLALLEIREAVVVAQEGPGGSRLVAYVVPQADVELDTTFLRETLGQKLPDYMVPGVIVTLDALPLTPNGKVDRKALPELSLDIGSQYEPPQGEVEEALAMVWAEVLGVERVGRYDNFFDHGGHSLLAAQMVARVQADMQVELQLSEVFKKPLLRDLAECIATLSSGYSLEQSLSDINSFIDSMDTVQ
ncbi:amino acid adenylation domain-containing protein [Halomonas sp. FeN2]|uniref:Non-ribosomal peptide synthetase n=1 Tax=Vreelandella neptunia TaxID=115551 RepID=A0ABZ0YR81_9GAMM|nr:MULTISPECIES: non-ribosomal peptide synthetase [Halomonas]TDV92711.1 amino acid adenylation domain-containing protein [Halomonas alkaliantarctica]MBF56521.1 non-ribosomal peptide synthetase [Halomonas sp.]MDN3558763.1 non-ribosomal peptide synthetase [Halomonas neptunia]UBR48902.1 amino acid adenylation domain-containing protein [Halomonas sp. FeN2]WQH13730.1 non-ribosomal peptide synthetase [Halomonas neptunia]